MLNIKELLVGTTAQMRNVIRWGTSHRSHDETVAEHHYYTTLYSMFIALDMMKTHNLTLSKVMVRAMVHDIEESITGDVPRQFKHSSPAIAFAIEHGAREFVKTVFNDLESNASDSLYEAWAHSKDHSIEGRIVKLADFLSVVSYTHQELSSGNKILIKGIAEISTYWESIYKDGSFDILNKYFPAIDAIIVEIAHLKGDVYGGMSCQKVLL